MTICHNCITGKVDGGFAKRIKRELHDLNSQNEKEVSQIKEQDKSKYSIAKNNIDKKYSDAVRIKRNEIPKRIGECLYCSGTGFR